MKTTTTINKNFKGLTVINGCHYYSGNLVVDGDCCVDVDVVIDGDLVIDGNLTCNKDIKVLGSILVHGNLTAGNIIANEVTINGDVLINESLDVELFCVRGNITVNGNLKTRRMSSCYGNLKAYNLVADSRIYCGGNINVSGKIYAPFAF